MRTEPTGPVEGVATDATSDDARAIDIGVDDRIGADEGEILEAVPAGAAAVTEQSDLRRRMGLAGQYILLSALAALVLLPVILTFMQALSTPFPYIQAGQPWRPVAVDWKDRTWFSGGAFSVVARSLVLLAVLAWIHLKAAKGGSRNFAPLWRPYRIAAIALGFAAIALLSGEIIAALHGPSSATAAWFVGSIGVVALTQFPGFVHPGRPRWRVTVYTVLISAALVTLVVVSIGAAVWTDAWEQGRLGPALIRSFVMSVLIIVLQLVTSVFAGYAFAFLRFPLKGLLFALVMATLLLPIEVTLLGNIQTIRSLGWTDSYQGLVAPFAATAFGIFLIRQGFRGIPPEIRDAARLDGYGHVAFMWRFAVPLTRPVIAAFTVVAALVAWNQYLWPQAIIDDERQQTAQIALRTITGVAIENANIGIAAALIVSLPVVVLLIAFTRQIVRGLTAGAIKG
jgi:sn-glycerol 3-phosphate transport system permease protein